MTTPVVTVSPETPLKDVAALLVDRRITAAPVVRDGEILGVVSEADIVEQERGPADHRRSPLARLLKGDHDQLSRQLAARTAAEAMTAPAVTIEWWQSSAAAAKLMTDRRVKRLPVVRDGQLVGIISRSDLVRAYARPDAEIEHEITEAVLQRSFWLDPGRVAVTVRGGDVTLTGVVDSEAEAEVLPRQVQRVPGVLSVTSSVTVRNGR